jgi:hypothetical protein
MRHLKWIAVSAALVACTLVNAPIAHAQSRLEITPFVGYYIASDLYSSYGGSVAPTSVGLENDFMWGGKLTASNERGGIEFAYTRTGSDVKLDRPLSGQPRASVGRLDIDSYDINFIGYQRTANPRMFPFGSIGFGWSQTHPTIDSDFIDAASAQPDGKTLFNFNFAIGMKYEMSPKLSTRIEGRWRVTDTNITTDSGVWCDPYGYCYGYASSWYNSGELIFGLSYALR